MSPRVHNTLKNYSTDLLKNAIPPNQIHADMQEKAIKKQINRGSLQKFELLEIRLRSIGAWMSYLSLDDNLKQNRRMKNAKKKWKISCSYWVFPSPNHLFFLVEFSVLIIMFHFTFQSYASILYLRLPPSFRIILRGKDVEHHNIVNDMMMSQEVTYRPQPSGDGVPKDTNVTHKK